MISMSLLIFITMMLFYDDAKLRKINGFCDDLELKVLFNMLYRPHYCPKYSIMTSFFKKNHSMSVFFTNFARFFVEVFRTEAVRRLF